MKLSYAQAAKRPALLERLTGLNRKEFEALRESFSSQYDQQVIQPRVQVPGRKRAVGGGQKGAIPEVADKLLFILVYSRIYPLLFVQGLLFGMAESKACTWVGVLLPALDAAMGEIHVRPKRATERSLEEIIIITSVICRYYIITFEHNFRPGLSYIFTIDCMTR